MLIGTIACAAVSAVIGFVLLASRHGWIRPDGWTPEARDYVAGKHDRKDA